MNGLSGADAMKRGLFMSFANTLRAAGVATAAVIAAGATLSSPAWAKDTLTVAIPAFLSDTHERCVRSPGSTC